MNTMAKVPLRTAFWGAIRQPGAVTRKILSERADINRFQYLIQSIGWDEKYIRDNVVDKIYIGLMILSFIYFCFGPGAYLAEIVFRTFG